jgi:hypothetical protein
MFRSDNCRVEAEASGSYEKLVLNTQTTRHHTTEDRNLIHSFKKLKSQIVTRTVRLGQGSCRLGQIRTHSLLVMGNQHTQNVKKIMWYRVFFSLLEPISLSSSLTLQLPQPASPSTDKFIYRSEKRIIAPVVGCVTVISCNTNTAC